MHHAINWHILLASASLIATPMSFLHRWARLGDFDPAAFGQFAECDEAQRRFGKRDFARETIT